MERNELGGGVIVRGRGDQSDPKLDRRISYWNQDICVYQDRGADGKFSGEKQQCWVNVICEWADTIVTD